LSKKPILLSVVCLLLLVSIAAAPAAAAALPSAAACPSSCSCLLPAEAQKAGSPGYCDGLQQACAADAKGVQKFCYEKPVTRPPAVPASMMVIAAPAGTTVTRTTTPVPAVIAPVKQVSPVAVQKETTGPVLPAVSARVPAIPPVPATTTGEVPVQGGILSGFAGIFGSLLGQPATSTPTRMISCNGILTDTMADPANCGGCGLVCPDGTCVMGTCRNQSGRMERPCGLLEILCNGACTDIMFNTSHCGNCTHACGPDDGCCSGVCTNFTLSSNCGGCGIPCGGGSARCDRGRCVCTDTDEVLCPLGYCRNLREDSRDCGACGNRCAGGESCCNGICNDFQEDDFNCGECGAACTGTMICERGRCIDTEYSDANCGGPGIWCRSTERCCEGQCRDLSAPATCGSCSNACPEGDICCDGTCTASLTDDLNCGTCGNTCTGGDGCCNGACTDIHTHERCGSCTDRCAWYEVCHKPPARFSWRCVPWWDSL